MNEKLFLFINSFAGHNQFLDKLGIFLAKGTPYIETVHNSVSVDEIIS